MGKYDTLEKLLTASPPKVVRLGGDDRNILRSNCSGSLAASIDHLDRELAPHREALQNDRVPRPEFFCGDSRDIGKLHALKKVAEHIRERGSMIYNDGITLLREKRSSFLSRITALTTLSMKSSSCALPAGQGKLLVLSFSHDCRSSACRCKPLARPVARSRASCYQSSQTCPTGSCLSMCS